MSGLVLGRQDDTLVDRASGWWGFDFALAVVMAGVYWLIARRVPVG